MAKKLPKKYRKNTNKRIRRAQYSAFIAVLFFGFILSWILTLRPTSSAAEKRELSKFPKFSFSSFCSGDYFDAIDLWFSDTFPLREALVTANGKFQSLYGFGNRIYGLSEKADAIPESAETASAEPAEKKLPAEIVDDIGGALDKEIGVVEDLGTLIVIDDSAYEVFNFNQSVADRYAATVNRVAADLDGTSKVYDIIVPTAIDITMPDKERAKCNSSSQADAIRYIHSAMSEQVGCINVYNAIRSHRSEYVYFRTDHHWTALGAYYAYQSICEAIGIPAKDLKKDFTEYVFDGFLGSFYSESGKNPALGDHRDTVYAYDPIGETTLTYYTKNGQAQEWKVIGDVTGWDSTTLYSTFIGGDYPYTHITNASTDSSRSCLVIKESFGNALVPFLAANYSEIHVVDYRHWSGSIQSFAAENQVDDILFVNNVSAVRSSSLMRALDAIAY